ncbi:MAG: fumarylacetoacetase [Betaproteobacteria bacterium RIFCSPLOWO2_12_FULL_65_14]|nr:MAG: fumarylacetoacetase [Betaproteobacteria bacterium RIFCSPLOWO2_12_FULL_65_14]
MKIDETHDPGLESWVKSANAEGADFPIQNLPFGIFRKKGERSAPRGGVAIGDQILDLAALGIRTGPTLNALAAQGRPVRRGMRRELSKLLSTKNTGYKKLARFLVPMKEAEMLLPVSVGDYSDFYTGIHHAANIGSMLRPDNPLLPNYKWVPIGYHGRASSIVASGAAIVRPRGQTKSVEQLQPSFGPSRRLDYEAELGFVVGPGNRLGRPVPVKDALEHVFGVVLLNDWSARDIQAWEYQPLGPFLAKSFASTISPWIVTLEALAPFRCPAFQRADGDPKPLPHLFDEADQRAGGFAIEVEMHLRSAKMRQEKIAPVRLSRGSFRDSYWTAAQIVAHQTSNGCNLQPGDLLGSGTLSGATPESVGSMMELTAAGKNPLELPSGESRAFLEDGDEVIERGRCAREGYRSIGFGEAAGRIAPAAAPGSSARTCASACSPRVTTCCAWTTSSPA